MSEITTGKTNEITVNFRNIALKTKCNRRASMSVKRLKKFIQKTFHSEDPVYISHDLNKAIFRRGENHLPGRVRVRVERGQCEVNPEVQCIRLSLVEVSSFKNLKDTKIDQ